MNDAILSLTADQILLIENDRPDKLFSIDDITIQYRLLASKWHPDKNVYDTTSVFTKIKNLKEKALDQLGRGEWRGPNTLVYTTPDKRKFKFSYKVMRPFDIGKMYIGKTKIMYFIDDNFSDLFDNAISTIKKIEYPDQKFKDQFCPIMPNIIFQCKSCIMGDIGHILIIEKSEDVFLLQDVIDYLGGKVPPKHVAWMISSMMNAQCFLNMNRINFNAILADNIFVSPKHHTICWYGGWWYAAEKNSKLKALPRQLVNILPPALLIDKLSKTEHNIQSIFSLGLYLLGDITSTGSKFLNDPDIPKELADHLKNCPSNDSIREYERWINLLERIWGPRKFLELNIPNLY